MQMLNASVPFYPALYPIWGEGEYSVLATVGEEYDEEDYDSKRKRKISKVFLPARHGRLPSRSVL